MMDFDCSDFGSANPMRETGALTKEAWDMANHANFAALNVDEKNRLTQGYIHAGQGRRDLIGRDSVYDGGAWLYEKVKSWGGGVKTYADLLRAQADFLRR